MRYALTFLMMATIALGQGVWPKTATVVDGGHRYDFDTLGKRSVTPSADYGNIVLWQAFSYSDNSDADFYTLSSNTSGDGTQGTAAAQPSHNTTDGGTITLDGIDDFINIDSVLTPLASTTAGTWSLWVNPTDATPTGRENLISFGDTDAAGFIFLNVEPNGTVRSIFLDGVALWQLFTDNAVLTSAQWTHLVVTQNGTLATIYSDAVAVAQTFSVSTDKTKWFSDLAGLDNGRLGDANVQSLGEINFFDGSIDDVRIYDTALTAAQIGAIYTNTAPTYGISP